MSCFLMATILPSSFAPLGITVFLSRVTGAFSVAAKVSPTLFFLLVSVCPTMALMAVPLGTVTMAIAFGSAFGAAGAGLGAGARGFFGTRARCSGWFEQPAAGQKPAT